MCTECRAKAASIPPGQKHDYHREWKKLYNYFWHTKIRPAILRRDPVCTVCKRRPSTIADHIEDHRGDPKLFYDSKNLRGVCKVCHDAKTGSMHGPGERKQAINPLDSEGRIVGN